VPRGLARPGWKTLTRCACAVCADIFLPGPKKLLLSVSQSIPHFQIAPTHLARASPALALLLMLQVRPWKASATPYAGCIIPEYCLNERIIKTLIVKGSLPFYNGEKGNNIGGNTVVCEHSSVTRQRSARTGAGRCKHTPGHREETCGPCCRRLKRDRWRQHFPHPM
jgi:hypothetical protein